MPASRRPYHHGDLRRALLDATLRLAARHGAAGVTLREAARVAGVSQTAPYRHFRDKDEMLAAASEEGFRMLHDAIQTAIGAAASRPNAQMLALVETYVRFALEHTAHFRLMFGHGSPPKSATPGLQAAARDVFQLFASNLRARRSGDVDQRLFRIWALCHGVATLALEKQILFDRPIDDLLAATRDAIAAWR